MRSWRPCGACGELVPSTGCEHWRPKQDVSQVELERRAKANQLRADQRRAKKIRDEVAAFHRAMGAS